MSDRLKNTLAFTNVAAGATVSLPHGLNAHGIALIPDEIKRSSPRFSITTVDETDISVTNNGSTIASCTLLVEAWHTYERLFGSVHTLALSPQPFVDGGDGVTDVLYATIRITDPGTALRPTVATAGATFGWLFAVGDECFFEVPLEPGLDRTKDMTISVSWAPSGNEAGVVVSWQLNALPLAAGDNVAAAGTPIIAADQAVPAVAATYVHTAIVVPAALFADPSFDEIHGHLTRIASSADPVSPPGIHHIAVIQSLI